MLRTAGAEKFGDLGEAILCPSFRVAWISPTLPAALQDIRGAGAMAIGALPLLGSGSVMRAESQVWARAIYEDRPAGSDVAGIRYTAAHDGGDNLCAWDTAPPISITRSPGGRIRDRALLDPEIYSRFLIAMDELRIAVSRVTAADCAHCGR